MDLKGFGAEYRDGLDGRIAGVRHVPSDPYAGADIVRVSFECDALRDPDPAARLHVEIECTGVREMSLRAGPVDTVAYVSEHPLLLEYNEPHEYLHFSSAPARPEEIIGWLYLAYREVMGDWRPLSSVLNPSVGQGTSLAALLRGGWGMLASGPAPVLSALAAAVAPFMTVYHNPAYHPDGRCRMLLFDEAYVVCDAAEVVTTETAPNPILSDGFTDSSERRAGSEDS